MSNPALLLDYLFAGALVQERLRATVGELAGDATRGVEDLAAALERSITAPTAFVLWEGDQFDTSESGSAASGKSQLVRQQWTVLLAVRNADQVDMAARNASCGQLLSSIHKALAGWVPEGGYRPFKRVQGRRAAYTANVALYPLTFEISVNL